MAPPLGGGLVPPTVRVAIVLAIAAALAGNSSPGRLGDLLHEPLSPGHLVAAVACEAALGATMAFGLNLAFAVFTFAGRLLDVQVGFGMGQVFDPMTRQQLPVLSAVFNQLALIGFFLVDGHHALVRAFALSVDAVPPGAVWPMEGILVAVGRQTSQLFSLGFAMAAPIVFCLMLVELGLGVLARNLPQMNTLVVGVPLKIFAALATLSLLMLLSGPIMVRIYDSAFAMWGSLWR